MNPASSVSQTSIRLRGVAIPGAEDRQRRIPGFDQEVYSRSRVVCIGAGGLISHIAPTLARKGIGALTLLDGDLVEPSNLNRQRFYPGDVGRNKAIALAGNLQRECIAATGIRGLALHFEVACERGMDLGCDVAICGVDNNPGRVAVARYFRGKGIPVIFAAVSADGDHGYVFRQGSTGACLGCLYPDMVNDDRYPCPGTPAIADILQAVGSLAVYSVDAELMNRRCAWNYRRISLSGEGADGCGTVTVQQNCALLDHA